jgi:hypothetical protein
MPDSEMLIRLGAAAALGSLIGFERERLLWAQADVPRRSRFAPLGRRGPSMAPRQSSRRGSRVPRSA